MAIFEYLLPILASRYEISSLLTWAGSNTFSD